MKAVTCQNSKLELADLPDPQPGPGQVVINVIGCGICGSDLHARHHADAEADAERVARELKPIADTLMIQPLGPVVGAHAGPGVVGVGCYPADLFPFGIKTASEATASR